MVIGAGKKEEEERVPNLVTGLVNWAQIFRPQAYLTCVSYKLCESKRYFCYSIFLAPPKKKFDYLLPPPTSDQFKQEFLYCFE